MRWNFVDTGFRSGAFNMEFDELLASRLEQSDEEGTLRVYGWNPPAISIGRHQRVEDFDADALERAGIDLVRRPTGGRAILHSRELTYSIVMRSGERSPREVYRFISGGLLQAFKLLGVDAALTENDRGLKAPAADPHSLPCFSSSAKDEIQYEGRKLAGSAQRRYGRVVLQHGSLLLGPQHRRIVEYLAPAVGHAARLIADDLANRTIDVESILGREVPFEECARAMKQGFELSCGITFEEHDFAFTATQPA
ncbi:MAG TPA: lipoate--protein ligase family protein [Bacteroidota bacterium]|jgi:lipoate-protein ligase A